MVKWFAEWRWSGHGDYLQTEKRGLIDSGPMTGELRTARYEAFIRKTDTNKRINEGSLGSFEKEFVR